MMCDYLNIWVAIKHKLHIYLHIYTWYLLQFRKDAGICECCKYVLSCCLLFENPLLCTVNPLVVSSTLISSFGHLVVTKLSCCVIY